MQQLEIKFFWPLTEQIPLDLDFKRSKDYDDEKTAIKYWAHNTITTGTLSYYNQDTSITTSLTIDVDNTPITVTSKEKPNFVKRYIYKILGVRWKAK